MAATINRKHFTDQNLHLAFEAISHNRECITSQDIQKLLGPKSTHNVDVIMQEVGLSADSKVDFEMVKIHSVLCRLRYLTLLNLRGLFFVFVSIKSPFALDCTHFIASLFFIFLYFIQFKSILNGQDDMNSFLNKYEDL